MVLIKFMVLNWYIDMEEGGDVFKFCFWKEVDVLWREYVGFGGRRLI